VSDDNNVYSSNASLKDVLHSINKKQAKAIVSKLYDNLNSRTDIHVIDDYNFTNSHTFHARITFLKWLYGSVYRKQTFHYFYLHDFDVNESTLQEEHASALDNFFGQVVSSDLMHKVEKVRRYEILQTPFVMNLNADSKLAQIRTQNWNLDYDPDDIDSLYAHALLLNFETSNTPSATWTDARIGVPYTNVEMDLNNASNSILPDAPSFTINKLMRIETQTNIPLSFSACEGRASATGDTTNNNQLSFNRASKVQAYLDQKIRENAPTSSAPDANISVQAVISHGANMPILTVDGSAEIAANRSVEFTYVSEFDYIDVFSFTDIENRYTQGIASVKSSLEARLVAAEKAVDTPPHVFADKDTNSQPAYLSKDATISAVNALDTQLMLGKAIVQYVLEHNPDSANGYNSLAPQDIFNLSNTGGFSNPNVETISVHINSWIGQQTRIFSRAPLEFALTFGSPTTTGFSLPISASDRLSKTTDYLRQMIGVIGQNYSLTEFEIAHGRFANFYQYVFNVNKLWAYSVGMRSAHTALNVDGYEPTHVRYSVTFDAQELTKDQYEYNHLANQYNIEIELNTTNRERVNVAGIDIPPANFWSYFIKRLKQNKYETTMFYWYSSDDVTRINNEKAVFAKQCLKLFAISTHPTLSAYSVSFHLAAKKLDFDTIDSIGKISYNDDALLDIDYLQS